MNQGPSGSKSPEFCGHESNLEGSFLFSFLFRITRRASCHIRKRRFAACGERVIFDPLSSLFSYERIKLGSNVFIAEKAHFRASHSHIRIGSNVLFGPSVYILGGNHIFNVPGQLMFDIKKDDHHQDGDVIIEDDVWIGARVTILSGVTIHEGAIVAAGTVVTKNVGAYEIHGGVPNHKLKDRFSAESLSKHRQMLSGDKGS